MQLRRILLMAAFSAGIAAGQSSFSTIEGTSDGLGSCGSPGLRLCSNFKCAPANSLQIDPYTAQDICDLPSPSCSVGLQQPLSTSSGGSDFTFLVITDTHFHNGYSITDADHLHHTQAINMLPGLNLNWNQAGAGFDNLPFQISIPPSIVTTGDSTNYGQVTDLGAFRLLYESGTTTDSINYHIYPGLGNHDVSGQCEFANCGRRMFDYVADVNECNTSVDSASHNYSWNWGQFHLIQLNMWAGDNSLGSDTTTGFTPVHGTGLAWLTQDLANNVGTSGKPVILFQHFGWDFFSLFNNDTTGQTAPWWTASERQQLLDIIKDYNVIALFSGHQHQTGMYGVNYKDDSGNSKLLDDFVGGAGGIGGTGQFYGVRLSDNFLDVLPFEWSDFATNTNPYITTVGLPGATWPSSGWNPSVGQSGTTPPPPGTPLYPSFYNNVNGCRKWIGGPLATVPLTVSFDPNNTANVVIQNNTGGTIQGPFALQLPIVSGVLNSVSFMGSCSQGPAYQNFTATQLAPGQSDTITLSLAGATDMTGATVPPAYLYSPSQLAVVSLGGDSFVSSTGSVTLTASTPAMVTLGTALSKNIPFTFQADSELNVTVNNSQTPATMTIALNTSAKNITSTAYVNVTPSVSGYFPVKITVNLGAVPITVTASGNAPITADGTTYATPYTFNWYPGDQHNLTALSTRQIDAGTQDRFTSWSAGGAASTPPFGTNISFTVPLAAANYIASYGRYYLVTTAVSPSGSGVLTVAPSSPDGYQIAGAPLTVTATPSSGYIFSQFQGDAPSATTNPFNENAEAPATFSAVFVPGGTYTIATSLNASGTETVDGQVYNGPASFNWDVASAHTFSVPAEIDGPTGTQYIFTSWSDGVTTTQRRIAAAAATNTYIAKYATQYLVTTTVSPSGAGTLTGGGWYNKGTSASLQATAASGFQFSGFSGALTGTTDPQSPTVNGPMNVVGNFQSTGRPALYASAGPRVDSDPAISVFTFVLADSGVGAAVNAQIDSVTATPSIGTGTITVPGLPLAFGTIPPGQAASQTININWPSSATRVEFTVSFSANSGAYTGQSTFYVFR